MNKKRDILPVLVLMSLLLTFTCGCSSNQITTNKSTETSDVIQVSPTSSNQPSSATNPNIHTIQCGGAECPSKESECCNGKCYDSTNMSCINGALYTGKRVSCGISQKVCPGGFECCSGECYDPSKNFCTCLADAACSLHEIEGATNCGNHYCPKGLACCGNECYAPGVAYCTEV